MGIAVNVVLLGLSFAFFVTALGFLSNSSSKIGDIPGYENNQKLTSARSLVIWMAVAGWITAVAMLVGVGLYMWFALETAEVTAGYFVYGLLFLSLLGCGATGVIAAIVASDISQSGVKDNKNSYRQAVIAAILGILGFVFLVAALIAIWTHKPKPKKGEISSFEGLLGGGVGGKLGGGLGELGELGELAV